MRASTGVFQVSEPELGCFPLRILCLEVDLVQSDVPEYCCKKVDLSENIPLSYQSHFQTDQKRCAVVKKASSFLLRIVFHAKKKCLGSADVLKRSKILAFSSLCLGPRAALTPRKGAKRPKRAYHRWSVADKCIFWDAIHSRMSKDMVRRPFGLKIPTQKRLPRTS